MVPLFSLQGSSRFAGLPLGNRRMMSLPALFLALALPACESSPVSPLLESGVELSAEGAALSTAAAGPMLPVGTHEVPASIDATGTKDVTQELLAFFATVPDGSTIVFRQGATYRVEGTLRLTDRHNLTLEGNGVRFISNEANPIEYAKRNAKGQLAKNAWRNRYHWHVEGGGGITLRNMSLRGPNAAGGRGNAAYKAALEAQHGINVAGAEGVLIENFDISYVHGDFVYVGGRTIKKPKGFVISRNITVRGGSWSHNGRQGIAVTSAEGVLVERVSMTETRRASIDLEPNSARDVVRNVVIRDSEFGPGRLLWLAAAGSSGVMENITLEGNRLLDGRTMSVTVRTPVGSRRSNFRIIGNTSEATAAGSGLGTIEFHRVDGVEVRNNEAQFNAKRKMTAVYAAESCRVTVEGNSFPGAANVSNIVPFACD